MNFLNEFVKYEPDAFDGEILDPCAGGDLNNPMNFPEALIKFGIDKNKIYTIDIRNDSRAEIKAEYLTYQLDFRPKMIITNPPFIIAQEIIEKALSDVDDNGFVIMLLRLNYFGGKKRKKFWDENMPKYVFVHNLDVVEMLCDWMVAVKRHEDGDIYKSIEINKERFGLSDQLVQILKNTVEKLR